MYAYPEKEGKYHVQAWDANLVWRMKSEYIDMFDEYFSGMLDEQEKLDFENRLKADIKYDQAFQE